MRRFVAIAIIMVASGCTAQPEPHTQPTPECPSTHVEPGKDAYGIHDTVFVSVTVSACGGPIVFVDSGCFPFSVTVTLPNATTAALRDGVAWDVHDPATACPAAESTRSLASGEVWTFNETWDQKVRSHDRATGLPVEYEVERGSVTLRFSPLANHSATRTIRLT